MKSLDHALLKGLAAALAVLAAPIAPVAAQEREQSAEEDMRGGGMTEERQLDDEAARQHFRVATRYYEEGRFRDAAAQFEEAYQLSGRPELLYNAYIAYREAHESRPAADMLAAYLEAVPDAPDHQNLSARLEQLRLAVEEQEAQRQQLTEAERRAEQEAQRAREAALARQQAEASPEAWPWVITGVGVAAVMAGAITGGVALSEASALRVECNADGADDLCPASVVSLEERRDSANTLAMVSDALLFGGAAVATAGLVLGLVFGLGSDSSQEEEEGTVETAFGCTATGCSGSVRGRF